MAAKIDIGSMSCEERLRRLAVVFAVELRLKIVTELYMRVMSPTQFHREFGGGSVSRVASNFQTLEKHGWLRYIRSAPGRGGRGMENFYRATELAFIDTETWALVPYSMRVTSSWSIFNQIAHRLRNAMEASCHERRPSHDLTCTSLLLDRAGWENVTEALLRQFIFIFEEQKDSQLRVLHTKESLLRADVFQISFEAPRLDDMLVSPGLVVCSSEPLIPFTERLSPVFADYVCRQIIAELNREPMSVAQFCRKFGYASVSGIYRRFKRLKEIGWLAKVHEKTGGKRRGATEVFYRATIPAIDGGDPWANVPEALSETNNWKTFERLSDQVKAAMKAGAFDRRPDRFLSWSLLSLDRLGWENVMRELDALLTYLRAEQERAKHRMAQTGEKSIEMVVAQAAFETPIETAKAP